MILNAISSIWNVACRLLTQYRSFVYTKICVWIYSCIYIPNYVYKYLCMSVKSTCTNHALWNLDKKVEDHLSLDSLPSFDGVPVVTHNTSTRRCQHNGMPSYTHMYVNVPSKVIACSSLKLQDAMSQIYQTSNVCLVNATPWALAQWNHHQYICTYSIIYCHNSCSELLTSSASSLFNI